jgi:hypothetical protein
MFMGLVEGGKKLIIYVVYGAFTGIVVLYTRLAFSLKFIWILRLR